MKQGAWSAGSAAISVSQVPFHCQFVWRHHFCACFGNWSTAGVGTSYLHYSHKWAFLWMTLSFYLLFGTNRVNKEQVLTFALILLASTVPACCLWPLPEIHICWASCCLLWLLLDLFLLWLQWCFYQLPSSTELREMVGRKNFLVFQADVGSHL